MPGLKKKSTLRKPWENPGNGGAYFGGSNLSYEASVEGVPKKMQTKAKKQIEELKKRVWKGRIEDQAAKARSFKWPNKWRQANSNCDYFGKENPGAESSLEGVPKTYIATIKAHLEESEVIREKRLQKQLDDESKRRVRAIRVKGWVPNGYAANNYEFDINRKRHTVGQENIHGKY
eukprot:CAMPEP_0197529108 /NCGR_PEP_ID=MMETSP1318-20131121/27292_1 /TAXON_ID=552666 /ORGANISM="Partenskyella glossopodia, Strain RCC365" /LENGTH=175 /DNA_ID=CAMNT_0043084455 /DNA_START=44 /DNA_END=571 /DNA_ORIENTATION=-